MFSNGNYIRLYPVLYVGLTFKILRPAFFSGKTPGLLCRATPQGRMGRPEPDWGKGVYSCLSNKYSAIVTVKTRVPHQRAVAAVVGSVLPAGHSYGRLRPFGGFEAARIGCSYNFAGIFCGVRSRFLSPSGCGTTAGPCAGRLRNGSKNDRAGYLFARMQGRRIFCPVRPLRRLSTAGQTGESIVPELSQPLCQPDFYRDITTVFVGVFSARVGSFWSFARIYIALCRTVRTNKSFRSERLRRIFCRGGIFDSGGTADR